MRLNYASRFWLYAPLVALAGLAVFVMSSWWTASQALDKKLTAANHHEIMPGITLSYGGKSISGFPFRMDVVFDNFRLEGAGAHGPFAWETEKFALHSLTYGRRQDIFEAAGEQSLSWHDGGGRAHATRFLPGTLHASAVIDVRGLIRFDLDMHAAAGEAYSAARMQLHLRRDPDGSDLDMVAGADQFQKKGNPAFSVGNVRWSATVSEAAALMPLLAGQTAWPDGIAAWKAKGGAVRGNATPAQDILSALY